MIALIDNYDSFTFNLVQRFGEIDPLVDIRVFRHDEITAEQLAAMRPERVVISPGPCSPRESGVSNDVIRAFVGRVPLLGVCLGHQCLAHVFGGSVLRARRLVHGKTSLVRHDGRGVYAGLPNPFPATRYHSLIVDAASVPADFEISAVCDDDPSEVMGIRHRRYAVEGVQFHPESFLTVDGHALLANFLRLREDSATGQPCPMGTR